MYPVMIPRWAQLIYPHRTWQIPTSDKILYLTFDDGPNPATTPFILDTLARYDAKATFFCIGKNVVAHPLLFRQIMDAGHLVGNHTYHHLNGWEETTHTYIDDIARAREHIPSLYFRPPYGRMTSRQARLLLQKQPHTHIIMWNILSGDFDTTITPEKCRDNIRRHAAPGTIIVLHDSDKAKVRMEYALPQTLEYFSVQGYRFESLP